MIRKEDAILVLQGLLNAENENKINRYIERLREMSDDQWQRFLKSKSINSVEQIEKIIDEFVIRRDTKIKLNDLISYGISGNTLHIHVVPGDLHNMLSSKGMREGKRYLIDALGQIKTLMQSKEGRNIDKVFAVSPIIRRPITDIFEELGFSTRTINMVDAKDDEEFQAFYPMFKGSGKKLGRAVLTREQLISGEWEQPKKSKKVNKGEDAQEL